MRNILVKDGFTVLTGTSDDIVAAKRFVDAGASALIRICHIHQV